MVHYTVNHLRNINIMSNLRIFLKFDVYRKYIDINYACEYIFFNMQIPENPKSIQATCRPPPRVYRCQAPIHFSCWVSSVRLVQQYDLHSPIFSPRISWDGAAFVSFDHRRLSCCVCKCDRDDRQNC